MKNELNLFYLLFMAILHFLKWLFRPIYRLVKYKPLTKFWRFYKETLAFISPTLSKSYTGRIIAMPFWIIIGFIGLIIALMIISNLRKIKYNMERDKKYKKVIKEGLFWDSVEYHEREQK